MTNHNRIFCSIQGSTDQYRVNVHQYPSEVRILRVSKRDSFETSLESLPTWILKVPCTFYSKTGDRFPEVIKHIWKQTTIVQLSNQKPVLYRSINSLKFYKKLSIT